MNYKTSENDACAMRMRSLTAISIANTISDGDQVSHESLNEDLEVFARIVDLDGMAELISKCSEDGDSGAGVTMFERLFAFVCSNMTLSMFTTGGMDSDYQVVIRGKPRSEAGPGLNGTSQRPEFGRAIAVASWIAIGSYFAAIADEE